MISKVLVALDDSQHVARIAAWGGLLAARFGASLHLLRVIPMHSRQSQAPSVPEHQLRAATEALNEIARSLMDAMVAPPRVRIGEPWRVLIDVASEIGADVIVLGAGRHGDQSLGSTASAVATRAPNHVFLVRVGNSSVSS